MKMVTIICLVFATYLANPVLGIAIDVQRDLDYTHCALNNHAVFIKGIENIVGTSDPLTLDVIPGNLPDFKYKYYNAQLTGLKNCIVTKLNIAKEKYEFKYNLECPHIEMITKYYFTGKIANFTAQEEGNLSVKTGLYTLKFSGYYDKNIGNDKKEHANIKYYHLDFEAGDNLEFTFANIQSGDEEQSKLLHKFIENNWKYMDKELRAPVLNSFMDVFINHLNDFLKVVPIEEVFKTSCRVLKKH